MIAVKEDTNIVNLKGTIENNLQFSHEIFGEKILYYKNKNK